MTAPVQAAKALKQVFDRPRALVDVKTHFCPGCHHGLAHRIVAEAIDAFGVREKAIGVRLRGLLGLPLRLHPVRRGRVAPRPRARRGHRSQAGSARQVRVHLPGRRRPRAGGVHADILPLLGDVPIYGVVVGRGITAQTDPAREAADIADCIHELWRA